MQILKLKSTTLCVMTFFMLSLMFTSCEREINEVVDQESLDTQEMLYSDGDPIKIIFSDDISGLSKDELIEKYKEASIDEKLQFQKNHLILDLYREKGIINESNYKEWESIPISEALLFENFLDAKEIEELNIKFKTVVESFNIITSRSNCQQQSSVCIPHPYWPYGAPICWDGEYTCTSNTIVLYEGNNITQRRVGVLDAHVNRRINIKSSSCCPNDEARSMTMFNMEAGQIVTVYDRSDSKTTEESCEIEILQNGTYSINSFQITTTKTGYKQTYKNPKNCNGSSCLDGKISSIRFEGN